MAAASPARPVRAERPAVPESPGNREPPVCPVILAAHLRSLATPSRRRPASPARKDLPDPLARLVLRETVARPASLVDQAQTRSPVSPAQRGLQDPRARAAFREQSESLELLPSRKRSSPANPDRRAIKDRKDHRARRDNPAPMDSLDNPPGEDGAPGAQGPQGPPGNAGEKGICPKYCAIDGGVFFEDGTRRSSSGIGRATALHFAANGAKVTIHGQNVERIEETKKQLADSGVDSANVHAVRGGLEDERVLHALIDETVTKFRRLDVLVNNAAIYEKPGDLDPTSIGTFDYVMAVNLRAPVILTKLATPHLLKSKGSIVNVSSILANKPVFCGHFYSASKTALEHFTKTAALDLALQGVRVNCVSLGVMNTPFLGATRSAMPADLMHAYENQLVTQTPMKRRGEPQEAAELIAYLASEAAAFVTGVVWAMDGGLGIVATEAYQQVLAKYLPQQE
ncbi:hypothetical protein M3Y99_00152200 [Aphelenchoides fujianensis]|nr:hypothetical protein M3Y99_00152200 [Aphelenchoides fujianensis]